MNETIIIGAPVFQREWILPYYFSYIERQTWPLERIGFVFEIEANDLSSISCLVNFAASHPEIPHFELIHSSQKTHKTHPEGGRAWHPDDYNRMTAMRNNILDKVIVLNPDRYFSLDTDILLEDPRTIDHLVELTTNLEAASPLCFMTPDSLQYPNVMNFRGDKGYRLQEYPLGKLFRADVIMAAVMMSKKVFTNIRYKWHFQGEDLGFAQNAAEHSYSLYNASYIYSPHIMSRERLSYYLQYGDIRKAVINGKINSETEKSNS